MLKMLKYEVKQIQEILVEYKGTVWANNATEALEKARGGDVEWSGEHSIFDTDYIGDWEAWYLSGELDEIMDEHYHEISGNALVEEADRCPVEGEEAKAA